jgi:pyruvate dehydrogenase E2 component (dihydrolipoamide acetyltransferase)
MSAVEIKLEDPGDGDEVEVIAVNAAAGDTVTAGTVLFEVATDKANMEIEAPADGVLESINVAEGDVVPADRVLAVLTT